MEEEIVRRLRPPRVDLLVFRFFIGGHRRSSVTRAEAELPERRGPCALFAFRWDGVVVDVCEKQVAAANSPVLPEGRPGKGGGSRSRSCPSPAARRAVSSSCSCIDRGRGDARAVHHRLHGLDGRPARSVTNASNFLSPPSMPSALSRTTLKYWIAIMRSQIAWRTAG